jgi:superfamily II DNA or RNA helicase
VWQPNIAKLHTSLSAEIGRNDVICAILKKLYRKKYLTMVISHRVAHCELLYELLPRKMKKNAVIFVGKSKHTVFDIRKGISNGGIRLILSTYQKSMEGLDLPELEFLVSVTPQRGVKQAMGRLERASKKARKKIFLDLVDTNIPICEDLYKIRKRYYERMGYELKTIDYRKLIER